MCVFLASCSPSPEAAATPNNPDRPEAPSREVTTVPAVETPIDDLVIATGTLAPELEIELGMKVSGRIGEVTVDLGTPVRKDQAIARLVPTDFELRVRQAEAALQQARVRLSLPPESTTQDVEIENTALVRGALARLEDARARQDRAARLLERGLMAQADFDIAVASFKVAEAQYEDAIDEARNRQAVLIQRNSELELARQQYADTVLYAPIDGMVLERHASAGQYVGAGAPIVTLVQIHPLRLQLAIPEREALNVRVGQSVRVTVDGAEGVHQGRIARISPSFDEANRTLQIEAEVSNPNSLLRPGAFARAEVVVSTGKQAVMVPPDALATFAGVDRVFTVEDGKAVIKRVTVGRRTSQGIEILQGLSAGERVVVNIGNLNDGDPVTVTE